ncbi:MAG TPA: DUF3298 domain-containing protein [Chryseolinea sp.]|nr:DUF3298 domain-containing protein [Chryseolinea sp.]
MNKLIVVICFCMFIFSCNKKNEPKKRQISYEMKTFRLESPNGCKSDTLPCAFYEVAYPVFSGLDSSVTNALQRRIDAAVSMGNPEAEGKSMKEIGGGFIEDFEDFKNEMKDISMGWHYSAEVAAEVVTDTLLSLSISEEYFTGGAHGGYGTYFISVRPSDGAEFTLSDFFKAGYEEPVTKIAEGVFRKVREIPDTASLNENMFEFPDDQFQLNDNYGFTKEGVVFYYNSYEIASYAAGPTEVVVPYESLKGLIKH